MDPSQPVQPDESQPGQSQPGQSQPGQSQPGKFQPGKLMPGQSEFRPYRPRRFKPGQTLPEQFPPGQFPPGQFPPGQFPSGRKPGPRYPRPRRRRLGLLRLLVILAVALFVIYAGLTPWALHIGGRFTPLETWSGYGTVQASNGGHYVLFTQFQGGMLAAEAHGGRSGSACGFSGCTTMSGTARLCTQTGRTYSFQLEGGIHGWWSTDRARTTLGLTGPELPDGWNVAFAGRWHGPLLRLRSPDNSFTEVFTPAGAIRKVTSTADAGAAGVTLRYGSLAGFGRACRALAGAH